MTVVILWKEVKRIPKRDAEICPTAALVPLHPAVFYKTEDQKPLSCTASDHRIRAEYSLEFNRNYFIKKHKIIISICKIKINSYICEYLNIIFIFLSKCKKYFVQKNSFFLIFAFSFHPFYECLLRHRVARAGYPKLQDRHPSRHSNPFNLQPITRG